MSATGTVTVLFTDLVGSTELAARLGREAAEEHRRKHFALLADAAAEAGGTIVKNLGDGLMVVFHSVTAALAAAVGMQQRTHLSGSRSDSPDLIRVGISVGEATTEDGDWFGPPVVEAARLCAVARGGQVLATHTVALLSSGAPFTLIPAGAFDLKGIGDGVPAYELAWEPMSAEAAGATPLPPKLVATSSSRFFGRSAESEQLERAWKAASNGEQQLVLISGEPGMGKTRLATEVAMRAHAAGATVLYGRCDQELGVPYQPFVEALSHYVEVGPAEVLDAHVAAHGDLLEPLAPRLRQRVSAQRTTARTDPETERYLLFAAARALLVDAARHAPVVLFVDDLHWADKPTVLLLRHIATLMEPTALLVIGTYRSTDVSRTHPLVEVLTDLRREGGAQRIELDGLDGLSVVSLFEAAAGHEMDESGVALAMEVRRETGGSPFFVKEILRHLTESKALFQQDGRWIYRGDVTSLGIPQSVREVVEHRVDRLGPLATKALSAASVVGHEFDLDLVAAVIDADEDDLLDAFDAAALASVIRESVDTPGRFSFAHALIQHTLYDELGATRRARIHRRVAESLERMCGDDPGDRLGELARHWIKATGVAAVDTAVHYARRTGEQALARLAPNEAARWFAEALEMVDAAEVDDVGRRCALLVQLGDAQRQAGDPAYRETLLSATALSRDCGDPDLMVRAALANNRGFVSSNGEVDHERVAAIEAALAVQSTEDSVERARLLMTLAAELTYAGDWDRRRGLTDESLAMAQRVGDPTTLAYALTARYTVINVPHTLEERLVETAENLELTQSLGDPVARFWALNFRASAALEAVDLAEVDRCTTEAVQLAHGLGQPFLRWVATWAQSWRALLAGDIDQAEALADAAAVIANESGQPNALAIYAGQLFAVRRDQGRLDELEPLIEATVEDNPGLPGFRAALLAMYCDLDRHDEARPIFQQEVDRGFADLMYDPVWSTGLSLFADVCGALRHHDGAGILYERLAPYAGQIITNTATVNGAVDRFLGILAGIVGRYDVAEQHFIEAGRMHEAIDAPTWLARTRYDWAGMLLSRGEPGDDQRAAGLLEAARQTARDLGMPGLERRAAALLR